MRIIAAALSLLMLAVPLAAQTRKALEYEDHLLTLKKGDVLEGFRVENVYLNAANQRMGARFIHDRTGFTFDYLRIESVPQGYTWVNSFPVGDQGEPHTQEHLLLGKGTVGRAFAGLDTMWLSTSTAFTQQWRTSYHFNTAAGEDVFFDLFHAQLNAMLHPNYTDEEIRREVRSFGVTENPDGTLRLEEKGSVYNEMTSSTANRYSRLFRAMGHLVYGSEHPLAYNAGGEPSGIRTMKPEDIRNFHRSTHYLANMGTMASFPKHVKLNEVLRRTNDILELVEPGDNKRASTTSKPLPPAKAAAPATIALTEYPHRNEQQPSPLALQWPATRNEMTIEELMLLELFLDTFAGDSTSNLYKLFVDSKTRVMETGATGVFSNVERDLGHPVSVIIDNVAPSNLTEAKIAEIRDKVMAELRTIQSWDDDWPPLKAFNRRVASRLIQTERQLANFVNTPPSWGARGTGSAWMDQLLLLERTKDFDKSVTLKPQIANVRAQLSSTKNIWRELLPKWQLTAVTPYGVGARPSPALLQREEAERVARVEEETKRVTALYDETDAQAALKKYRADQDAEAARIEEEAKKIPQPAFAKNPPMTLDDALQYESVATSDDVPIVVTTFENMTAATFGVAFNADVVAREHLRYLSLLPALMTRVGVINNGRPINYDEMSELLREQILRLDANFSTNPRTQRVELVLRGAGIGENETRNAIQWMSLVLHHPDWRPENLPRIRDVVDQTLSGLRNTMQGSEESWVQNPMNAYRMQTKPVFLAADSFLTRLHNALRLRWLLKDVPAAADAQALQQWFAKLESQTGSRADLKAMLAKPETFAGLSDAAAAVAKDAAKDLDLTLLEIPDSSLAADWKYLVGALRSDLFTEPAKSLEALDALRRSLLPVWNAREYLVTSDPVRKGITASVEAFTKRLDYATKNPAKAAAASSKSRRAAKAPGVKVTRHIDERLLARDKTAKNPVYVGLLAPNMKGGVIITSVPGVHFSDAADRNKQLDYLAGRLHAGYGAHGIFLKTIGAGLAYSNGLRATVQSGRTGYYAERTPEIPQTVKFVIDNLKNAERNPKLSEYAIAQVFGESRAAATYEARAEGIALDLADGQPPQQVRRFRNSILALRKDPTLGEQLFNRKDTVYGRILPGYAPKSTPVADSIYFTIGPDKQLDAWEAYLKNAEGPKTTLYRLYPRDYWMP
jgi:Zn-dependent M16 (insulinase) family peptidase